MVARDFSEAWIIDLKGNARTSGERRRREGGNVFEDKIRVGVAIAFFVKLKSPKPFRVRYLAVADYVREDDKREFVARRDLANDSFEIINPDKDGNWINQPQDDGWRRLASLADPSTKGAKDSSSDASIFKLYSLGVVTSRDDWAWDRNKNKLEVQIKFNIEIYNRYIAKRIATKNLIDYEKIYDLGEVKWTRLLRGSLEKGRALNFDSSKIWQGSYRPFSKQWIYYDPILNEVQYQTHRLFDGATANPSITTMGDSSGNPYFTLAIDTVPDLNFVSPASGGTMTFSRYRYTKSGERVDNITDWAVAQFATHYGEAFPGEGRGPVQDKNGAGAPPGSRPAPWSKEKDAIFAYVYAVLHDPLYREKYALNLKREFPRIPFYPDFSQWAAWGEALLKLRIDYEQAKPFKLTRTDIPAPKRAAGTHPKPKLKSIPETGTVIVDEDTQLTGIPSEAWTYRLGNRSAIDWVLDQHKEKTPRDPTIRAKFNTYRFADNKEDMIKLLAKVVTVSLETVKITDAMRLVDHRPN